MSNQAGKGGYGQVRYDGKLRRAHRVAFVLARGHLADDECALHKCDNRACCNPRHLFRGSQADNVADMRSKDRARGGKRYGADNPAAKLTIASVMAIRAASGSRRERGALFGVSASAVRKIDLGLCWADG